MDLIPKGLQIKKHPAFELISKDINIKWNNILWDTERNQVGLLLYQSWKVIDSVELDLGLDLQLNEKDKKFQKNLDKGCLKKWINIK